MESLLNGITAFVPLKDTFMNRNAAATAVISGNCEKGTEKLRNTDKATLLYSAHRH